MGLLGDVYSYGDTLKRKVKGLLDDPRGTLDQFVGQLGDDQNANIANMQTGYGFGGNKSVLADPAQVQAAQKALADYGAQSGMAAATVWHGSPHKFDKFDSSKIGTGEGAQAYGHGLYLAENPAVAKDYQSALARRVVPEEFASKSKIHRQIADRVNNGEDVYSVADSIQAPWRDVLKARDEIAAIPKQGALYKVDLPDEHIAKMLDWDKPLSQQHPDVQALLPGVGNATRGSAYDWKKNLPMGDAYRQMVGDIGGEAKAAQALREAGIPGIRYLDGGSRGAGQGSSNFVVFPGNEGLLKILERNGQGLLD